MAMTQARSGRSLRTDCSMANAAEQRDENFPVFELGYFDSLTGGPNHLQSTDGKVFLRLASGGAFHWISLRILSSQIPFKLKYKCLYRREYTGGDVMAEALEGVRCPPEGAAYIKKVAFESKIYYRCWLSRYQRPDEPAGPFWYPSGRFYGTEEDNRWITALDIKMPRLVDGWRSA